MVELRPYQQDALKAVLNALQRQRSVLLEAACGAGKTILFSAIIKHFAEKYPAMRSVILAHRETLVRQARDKLLKVWPKGMDKVGMACKSACSTVELEKPVVIASPQTLAARIGSMPPVQLAIVDEVHRLPPADRKSQYGGLMDALRGYYPEMRLLGVTATPYRLNHGYIYGEKCRHPEQNWFTDLAYRVGIYDLQGEGFLVPLKLFIADEPDLSDVGTSSTGDWNIDELAEAMSRSVHVNSAVEAVRRYASDRHHIVVFGVTIEHAELLRDVFREAGYSAVAVHSKMGKAERDAALFAFDRGDVQIVCNVGVLTEGWDCTSVDCMVMCRPTKSAALYCLDEETEVLTAEGWKRDIAIGEHVAGFDVQTNEIRFVPATGKIRRFIDDSENFYSIKGQHSDIRVTCGHRMVWKGRKQTSWKISVVEDIASLADGIHIPVSGNAKFKGVPLSDAELRFIGWVMTDGSISHSNNVISITQSSHHVEYIEEIENCIQQCGFKYGKFIRKRKNCFKTSHQSIVFTVSFGKPRGRDKHLSGWERLKDWISKDIADTLMDMDERQFAVMLEAVFHADGRKHTVNTMRITKGNRRFIERLQIMAVLRGYRANLSVEKPCGAGKKPLYTVSIKKQAFIDVGSKSDSRPQWHKEPYSSESCWCVENELGTLVTRRNGKVAILGNCQMAGRGLRLHEGKTDCLMLDLSGNYSEHGRPEEPKVRLGREQGESDGSWECPECHFVNERKDRVCASCGYERPEPEPEMRECPWCRFLFPANRLVCPHCGQVRSQKKTVALHEVKRDIDLLPKMVEITSEPVVNTNFVSKKGNAMIEVRLLVAEEKGDLPFQVNDYLDLDGSAGEWSRCRAHQKWMRLASTNPPRSLEEAKGRIDELHFPPRVLIKRDKTGKYWNVAGW